MEAPQTETKVVVSFDIGVKNLACCVLTAPIVSAGADECSVVFWKIFSLAAEKEKIPAISELTARLYVVMDEFVDTLAGAGYVVDTVLIENQPSRLNGAMKSLQMLIYGYFQLRKHWEGSIHQVLLISAKQKLLGHEKDIASSEKTGYELNKWKSVQYTLAYIEGDMELNELFRSYKKKDDLGDALLQGLAWLRKHKHPIERVVCVKTDLNNLSVDH